MLYVAQAYLHLDDLFQVPFTMYLIRNKYIVNMWQNAFVSHI